jgi:hypothetical protein
MVNEPQPAQFGRRDDLSVMPALTNVGCGRWLMSGHAHDLSGGTIQGDACTDHCRLWPLANERLRATIRPAGRFQRDACH